MKCSKLLIISLIIIAAFPLMAQAQTDLNGTLKRNNFTSSKWNESSSNIVLNLTTHRIYLDQYNTTGGLYENFTLFTEYEETLDYITDINETHFRAKADLRYGRYLYYDYGLDYFENFTIRFAVKINGIGNGGLNENYYLVFTNETVGDKQDYSSSTDSFIDFRIKNDNSGDDYQVILQSAHDGESLWSGWIEDNDLDNDWLYVQLYKLGNYVNYTIYDNSDFTGLHWTGSVTHTTGSGKYRYLYPINSQDLNLYPGFYIDVWVKELDLSNPSKAYYPSGEYFTVDLLENETGKAAYSLYVDGNSGASYPLEKWFSEDNSTWITFNDECAVIEDYNYSSFYLRFRLNSSSGVNSPYVDYYHLFYKETDYSPSSESGLQFGDLYWFMLAAWIVLNVLGRLPSKNRGYNGKGLLIIASVMGLIEGIMLLNESHILAYLFFILNLILFMEAASSK